MSQGWSSADIPIGSEIIAINGRTAPELTRTISEYLTADGSNQTKKRRILNDWFNQTYCYYVENPDEFTIEYHKPESFQLSRATVPAIRNTDMFMTTMSIYFEQTQGAPYGGSVQGDHGSLAIRSFQSSKIGMRDYRRYLEGFFSELKDKEIPNLVIDLRGNWGGSPRPAAHLFSYLISEPTPYFEETMFFYANLKRPIMPAENHFTGSVYILIDGASFSTTGHLCSLLRYHEIGTFIGEESGGGAVVTDGSRHFTLKNTKIRLNCATRVFKTAVSGLPEGRGVTPDYEITYSLQDYLDNYDPQSQKAIELMSE